MYLCRLTSKGMSTNKYWYSKEMNHGVGTVHAMPNCTTYVVGRSNEIANVDKPLAMFKSPYTAGGFPTAKDFIKYSLWNVGTKPRVGAIAVWGTQNDKTGHVAVVESFEGDKITVSQSNYKGTYFEKKVYEAIPGKVTSGVGYVFMGYMYNPWTEDNRVSRNKDKDQVDILISDLNVRKTPNGDKYSGRFALPGLYNVLDKVDAGGYRWLKLDNLCWIAQNDDDEWTCYYEAESESLVKDLQLKIEILTDEIDKLKGQLDEKTKEAEEIRASLSSTADRLNSALAENKLVSTELEQTRQTIEDAINVLRR